MVRLDQKPFYLDAEGIAWVRETIASMTLEEKIGQLFFSMNSGTDEEKLAYAMEKYHPCGIRYVTSDSKTVRLQNELLQRHSKIPLIVATNVESGGEPAASDGTSVGGPTKIAACKDVKYARMLGEVAGREALAIGSNLCFAPVVDILYNWRNSVIATRAFSNDPVTVRDNAIAYMEGAHSAGLSCVCKHFPGDGMDERDQHLSNSVNTTSCEEWMNTFGLVYKGMIDAGVEGIMAGHIMHPAWTRAINPDIKDEDIQPATLSPELLQGLLRDKLGFNGMIVTDASHMVGLTCRMKRKDLVPGAIAAGCDAFLFFNDPEEDFGYMMDGYKNGVITEERLQDALERILGLKAHMGLHKKTMEEIIPTVEGLAVVGCADHQAIAREVADHAITLVKNKQPDVFPITPERYPRIYLVPARALSAPGENDNSAKPTSAAKVKTMLEAEGFKVDVYRSPAELAAEGKLDEKAVYTAGKTAVSSFVDNYDLVILVADLKNRFQTVERVAWTLTKGGTQIPWYVHELPVVVVSTSNPFFLADVPQAKTLINCYDEKEHTLAALVDKLMGRSEFKGESPVDAFCGMWDTGL